MPSLLTTVYRTVFLVLCALNILGCAAHSPGRHGHHHHRQQRQQQQQQQRPIYAIAHRVLSPSAVTAALSHGANAIEVDLTAQEKTGWWADHSGEANSTDSTAQELFTYIANERRRGQNVTFVWLDIKNPDLCDPKRNPECSIEALRDLTRKTLQPAGVKALYGFYQTADSRGFKVMSESITNNGNEAVVLSGKASEVAAQYKNKGIEAPRMLMDDGFPQMERNFGNCQEPGNFTCAELRNASEMRDQGRLGKIMGWTSTRGDSKLVDMLLGTARVDGIIYGFQDKEYRNDPVVREAFGDIRSFVVRHSDSHRMAAADDVPW